MKGFIKTLFLHLTFCEFDLISNRNFNLYAGGSLTSFLLKIVSKETNQFWAHCNCMTVRNRAFLDTKKKS